MVCGLWSVVAVKLGKILDLVWLEFISNFCNFEHVDDLFDLESLIHS